MIRKLLTMVMVVILMLVMMPSGAKAQSDTYAYITIAFAFEGVPYAECNSQQVQPVHVQLTVTTLTYSFDAQTNWCGQATFGPFATTGTSVEYWVKGYKYLARRGTAEACGVCSMLINTSFEAAGDGNDDNICASADFNIMKTAFGTGCGAPLYNWWADWYQDCLVNVSDYNLLRENYGTTGAPPII